MGALIILHGLFLLDCSMKAQQCYILVAKADPHVYRVGLDFTMVDIPFSNTMTISLPPVTGKNPDADSLDERTLVLESSAVNVLRGAAVMQITVPMPDYIYSANRVQPFREDILNNSDPTILRSQKQRVMFGETLLLSYTKAGAFNLVNNGAVVQSSQAVKNTQVMAFYSWPATCGSHPDHSGGLNRLLETKAHSPVNLMLMGIGAALAIDDAGAGGFGLTDSELRPPCIHTTELRGTPMPDKDRKGFVMEGVVHIFTATETGCGSVVNMEP
jgi:hypothetical protein